MIEAEVGNLQGVGERGMTKVAMEFGEETPRSAALARRVDSGRCGDMRQERLELWWQLKQATKIQ